MQYRLARSSAPLRAVFVGLACLALSLAGCSKPRSQPAPGPAPPPLSSGPLDESTVEAPDSSASPKAPLPLAPPEEIVTVRPTLIDDILVNPGIGLQTFQRFDGQ